MSVISFVGKFKFSEGEEMCSIPGHEVCRSAEDADVSGGCPNLGLRPR